MAMISLLLAVLTLQEDGAGGAPSWDVLSNMRLAQEKRIVETLRDETAWTDTAKQADLAACIRAAGRLRVAAAAPLLARRIEWSPLPAEVLEQRGTRPIPEEMSYPARVALEEIGLPSVPPLLEVIAESEPRSTRYNVATTKLAKIYEQAGFGKQLARRRLELAADAARTTEARARLAQAAAAVMEIPADVAN